MIFTDPKDFTDCCGGLGHNDGHAGLLSMPHLHADNCPLRIAADAQDHCGSPPLLFREDPQERQSFDRSANILGGGDPLLAIASALDSWGRARSGGSFAQQCFVMANECIKASDRLKKGNE